METKDLFGMVIAFIAVTGGLGIGAFAIYVSMNKEKEEKLAKMEAQHKERLALIEKGLDPSIVDKKPNPNASQHLPLIWGLLLMGVGFGAFAGFMVAAAFNWNPTFLANAFALLFGGLGLIIYYIITRTMAGKTPK